MCIVCIFNQASPIEKLSTNQQKNQYIICEMNPHLLNYLYFIQAKTEWIQANRNKRNIMGLKIATVILSQIAIPHGFTQNTNKSPFANKTLLFKFPHLLNIMSDGNKPDIENKIQATNVDLYSLIRLALLPKDFMVHRRIFKRTYFKFLI